MDNKRVVITGVGILAPNAEGRQAYWDALRAGKPGYAPATLFDASEFRVNQAGEVAEFDATVYMGKKGLRTLDRATKLLVSTAKLAIEDSGFTITDENTDDIGVSVGTTFGSLKSIAEFDEVTLREGPRYTNPALFPNTVINSPASQVSIWHNIKGFNTTISTGFTASLDAMQYAWDFLQLERAKLIYSGGVEEMCWHTYFGMHELQFLSGSKEGEPFVNCPFDRRRNGITFGEGAVLFAMEDLDHARARGARIWGEILSFGYSFDPFRLNRFNPRGPGVEEAIKEALDESGLDISDIDYICANANSTPVADRVETMIIKKIFGSRAKKIPVSAIKSMIGETYSVSGAMGVAAALGAINEGFVPPTINYQEPDPDCDLDYVPNTAREHKVKHALVVNFSPSGSNTMMVLRKWE